MKLKLLTMALLAACLCGAADESFALVVREGQAPWTFVSPANEFSHPPEARSLSFKVDGAKLFAGVKPLTKDGAVKLRIRATTPETEAVEISLHQGDRKTWGSSSLSIGTDWEDVYLPFHDMKYFGHWPNMPKLEPGEEFDPAKLVNVSFCFGKWLCKNSLAKAHGFEIESVAIVRLPPGAYGDGKDHSLDEFPALDGEPDDTARLRRAIRATPNGTLTIPRGTYRLSSPLKVQNRCSFNLNKNAKLVAVKPMPVVLDIDTYRAGSHGKHDYNVFFRGGVIDGNGLASCLKVRGFAHYTLADATFLNGKEFGLRVDGGYEIIANNLYFKCVLPGLAGNSGVYVNGGDSHYTDCIVVDYTYGFNVVSGGSNRFTRCHVWGGPIPPPKPGELPEMLKGSINFWIQGGGSSILRDCYADTGEIGYLVNGWDTRLIGCSYFNNKGFGLDHITIIKHTRGRLLVSEGGFVKTTPHVKVYEGTGEVEWRDMMYSGFTAEDDCPGALSFKKSPTIPALKLAE